MNKENIKQYLPKNANAEIDGNAAVFPVAAADIVKIATDLRDNEQLALKLITATDERAEGGDFKIWYVFSAPQKNIFVIPYLQLKDTDEFPSLAPVFYQALNYEKRIRTFFGLKPLNHADSQPIILHENWPSDVFPLRKDFSWQTRPALAHNFYHFKKVKGEGIYEIPVGPIHAGIIEPGHFRFSVAGERIVLLEPRLGFVHKGSEKLFEILPLDKKIILSEKISGDSSFSHSLAFCQALEQLSESDVPARALYLRVIYAELERLANHFGDIGAIMMDTGFNFGGSNGARLREMIMQLNEQLTGSRFLRGVNAIGGVTKDIGNKEKNILSDKLIEIAEDFAEIIRIAGNSISLSNRLQGTGTLTRAVADEYDIIGVAGRAAGRLNDARVDYPYAAYDKIFTGEIVAETKGDVQARFFVRVKEAHASIKMIQAALEQLPKGDIINAPKPGVFKKKALAISMVEGWRGEIVYFVATDAAGNISRVAPRDPSVINWTALPTAGFGNIVPDFPLINKSFNMSYSGNDL